MTILLIVFHIAGALFVTASWKRGQMHFSSAMLPAVFLLPLWGPACAVAAEIHIREGEKGDEEAGTGPFGITDQVYRSIRRDKKDMSGVLPIEDVLETGTPASRRSLLLSVLHEGPAPFVRPLRSAGINDDTEVVHYAVTALVELRSEYTQRIARMEAVYQKNPSNPKVLLEYADLDEEYLGTSIPDSSEKEERLAHCRAMIEELLNYLSWQETGSRGLHPSAGTGETPQIRDIHRKRVSLVKRLGDICLQQGDTETAEAAGRKLLEEIPDSEDGYMLILRAKAAERDGKGLAGVIRDVRSRGIYLSPAARDQIAFWSA